MGNHIRTKNPSEFFAFLSVKQWKLRTIMSLA